MELENGWQRVAAVALTYLLISYLLDFFPDVRIASRLVLTLQLLQLTGIILIVFLPILALEGVEGKLFKPMALTMVFALAGSLIAALCITPRRAEPLVNAPKRVF